MAPICPKMVQSINGWPVFTLTLWKRWKVFFSHSLLHLHRQKLLQNCWTDLERARAPFLAEKRCLCSYLTEVSNAAEGVSGRCGPTRLCNTNFLVWSAMCKTSIGMERGRLKSSLLEQFRLLLLLLLLLWYILRGLSSSKELIGGLSSIVQDKKDNRKERKTKRKKKIKKKEKKKNSSEDRRRKSQNRQEEGKKDAPVQNWKLKT